MGPLNNSIEEQQGGGKPPSLDAVLPSQAQVMKNTLDGIDKSELGAWGCAYVSQFGILAFANEIRAKAPQVAQPQHLVGLIDALGGNGGTSFPFSLLLQLLHDLDVRWRSFSSGDLSALFLVLVLVAKAQRVPVEFVGSFMAALLGSARPLSPADAAAITLALFDDGWADKVESVGHLLKALLSEQWRIDRAPEYISCLVSQLIAGEELDLLDFHELDAIEQDSSHNLAVRLGILLDSMSIAPPHAGPEVSARIASLFISRFGPRATIHSNFHQGYDFFTAVSSPAGAGAAGAGEQGESDQQTPRAGLFIGRVLQQLSFAQEHPRYSHYINYSNDNSSSMVQQGTNNNNAGNATVGDGRVSFGGGGGGDTSIYQHHNDWNNFQLPASTAMVSLSTTPASTTTTGTADHNNNNNTMGKTAISSKMPACSQNSGWKTSDATRLCCRLCAELCSLSESAVDWRMDGGHNAYLIGECLRPLKIGVGGWSPLDVKELVAALQNASKFPPGCRPASKRVILQVLEGLGSSDDDFEIVVNIPKGRKRDWECGGDVMMTKEEVQGNEAGGSGNG